MVGKMIYTMSCRRITSAHSRSAMMFSRSRSLCNRDKEVDNRFPFLFFASIRHSEAWTLFRLSLSLPLDRRSSLDLTFAWI